MQECGYEGIELGPWGYLPKESSQLKKELEIRSLKLTATTLMGDLTSSSNTDEMISLLDQMAALQLHFSEAQYVVLIDDCYTDLFTGELIRPKLLSDEEWGQLIENIGRVQQHAKEKYGLEVVFHPHAETHVETEDQIERLLKEIDIPLCLDTGHHAYAGGDPVRFMEKHHARIPYLHIKNCDMDVREKMKQENWAFAKAVSEGVMCEPDIGVVDMKEFFDVLNKIQFSGWAIVEQDMYPAPFEQPFPIAKRTKAYLETLGRSVKV